MNLKAVSIPYTSNAVIKVATITITALLCNSFHAGHETFVASSRYVSFMYAFTLFTVQITDRYRFTDCYFFVVTFILLIPYTLLYARAERFELPSTVLETAILPLNYARLFSSSCEFVIQNPNSCLQTLFNDFSYLSCTYCSSAFTNCEAKTFVHRNGLN